MLDSHDGASDGPASDHAPRTDLNSRIEELLAAVPARVALLEDGRIPDFIACDLPPLVRAFEYIRAEQLAPGSVFCEWGSGLGSATLLASLYSYTAYGIEIESELIDASRQLAKDVGIDARFVLGSFHSPGDGDLLAGTRYAADKMTGQAYVDMGCAPDECDVVFSYPWPGEELLFDTIFLRHSKPGALLLTFHGESRLLLQRHDEGEEELRPLGWM